ncbi:SemiSWEET transporter [Candidatus Margulisiibacteriota bacterium]
MGISAAFLTTISFLPQIIKAYKSKETKDLSLMMYLIFSSGVLLWLVYGIMLGETPIIIANSIAFIFGVFILSLKVKYG